MKNAVVYYFSGTGNTEYTGNLFKKHLENNGVKTDIAPIDFIDKADTNYDLYIFGYPIYAWHTPKPFNEFINKLTGTTDKKAIVFSTCASSSMKSEHKIAGLLAKKGFDVLGAVKVKAVPNYPPGKIPTQKSVEKFKENADKQINEVCKQIINNGKIKIKKWRPLRIFGNFAYNMFSKFGIKKFAEKLYANENCNLCRMCVKFCPENNISVIDNVINVGSNCSFCLRCLNSCPKQAVSIKNKKLTDKRYRGPSGNYKPPVNKKA